MGKIICLCFKDPLEKALEWGRSLKTGNSRRACGGSWVCNNYSMILKSFLKHGLCFCFVGGFLFYCCSVFTIRCQSAPQSPRPADMLFFEERGAGELVADHLAIFLGHALRCRQVKGFFLQDRTLGSKGEDGVPQVGVGKGTSLSLLSAGGLCPGTQDTPALAAPRSDRAPPPRWQLWEAAGSLRKPLVDGKTTHWLSGGRFLACSEEAPGGTQQATSPPNPPARVPPVRNGGYL